VHEGEAGLGGSESWQRAALVRWRLLLNLAMADSRTHITRTRIFEMVLRRIIMLKEAGES